jgi:hypothetical protein
VLFSLSRTFCTLRHNRIHTFLYHTLGTYYHCLSYRCKIYRPLPHRIEVYRRLFTFLFQYRVSNKRLGKGVLHNLIIPSTRSATITIIHSLLTSLAQVVFNSTTAKIAMEQITILNGMQIYKELWFRGLL